MLTNELRQQLNIMNGTAYKTAMGTQISSKLGCLKGTYDFAKQGGAVGSFNLLGDDDEVVSLPAGALVLNAILFAKTACASGGSATMSLEVESAADLLAATAVASFSSAAKLQGVPDFGTLADSVLTTAVRNLVFKVAVAALTAGKVECYVFYVLT